MSIHDQGAGGSGNVLKEIVDPFGGKIDASKFISGDPSMTALELWTAEYQEQDAILMAPENLPILDSIASRENLPYAVVGTVTNTGKVQFWDSTVDATYVDLPLEKVLGKVPQKVFKLDVIPRKLSPMSLPQDLNLMNGLERVWMVLSQE